MTAPSTIWSGGDARVTGASEARPVLLATFDVPVDPDAAALAIDAAVESGQPLVVVNVVDMPLRPMTASWGQEVVVTADVDSSLSGHAELARSLAVSVERFRLVSPRPVTALLEFVAERRPGLLVLAPDRARMGKRRLARLERKIRAGATCLVWSTTEPRPDRVALASARRGRSVLVTSRPEEEA